MPRHLRRPMPPTTGRLPSAKNREHTSLSQFVGSLRRLILRDKSNQVEISPLDGTSAQFPAFLTTRISTSSTCCGQAKDSPVGNRDLGSLSLASLARYWVMWASIQRREASSGCSTFGTMMRLSLRTGQRYSETDYELPEREVVVAESGLFEGDAVVHGASSEISWMEDGMEIKSFEFECRSSQGAVLAITSPTELQELTDFTALREHIVRNAELLYRHANSICRIADTEALYVITGCIKSESWALAAFNDPTTSPADTLKLVKRQGINRHGNGEFVWTRRGTSEARVGKSRAAGACDQSLFLRGFKLDFSQKARSRMRATKPRTLSHGCKNAGATINHTQKNTPAFFGCARVAGGHANLTLEKYTLGRFPAVEEYTSDSDNDDAYITSPTNLKEPRSGYESSHPCDHINHYLLENVSDSRVLHRSIHLKHP
ncbi:hypothetical protein FA13DRAFT_374417 [Coprinellus micaceus]|uniref:Uncharacterized protein n=1 Tax=Coprinellus micaceus TaxID=71717 RepID=A0A4Y7SCG7_COPMI|nr:hypothetical protein FA13DRAFT_374417 [Coprinellus micaceus]